MAIPAEKSKDMESFLESISQKYFGRSRVESIRDDKCIWCGKKADSFRNELSKKEYTISGLCQKCQDSIFGGENNE